MYWLNLVVLYFELMNEIFNSSILIQNNKCRDGKKGKMCGSIKSINCDFGLGYSARTCYLLQHLYLFELVLGKRKIGDFLFKIYISSYN